MTKGKYHLPRIEEVQIRGFSLYSKKSLITTVNETIGSGVYCLAGANGLGKTTFLNIINYCLTGIVLEPNNSTHSPNDIISSNKDYTERYFNGRIHASDRKNAEVELSFILNDKIVRISRSFFNRNTLNSFEVYQRNEIKKDIIFSNSVLSPEQLNNEYQTFISNEIGIGNFNYFIFYQLYVLTFDENRRMIFWDKEASTNTLSLAFNEDLEDANNVLILKKDMDTLESYGRNARWQATQIKNEKENLIAAQKQKELTNWEDLKKQYEKLGETVKKKEEIFDNVKTEYDTLLKRQNIINSELLQQKTSYNKLFSLYSEPRSKITDNKYVKYSIGSNECFVCGAKGHHVSENIEKKIHLLNCPLCNTTINEHDDEDQSDLINKLRDIDKEINEKNRILEKIILETESKNVELEKIENEYYLAKDRLKAFEKDNSDLRFDTTGDIPIDQLIKDYQKRFEEADHKSKEYYKKRDKLQPKYDNLIEKISSAYDNAVTYFVPLFKEIARSFIGLDLNIYFKRVGRDLILKFELLGTARTESTQLSESQRFFLDIALRMALAIYLSKDKSGATLLIDTPEGSLDIAYESRVGRMFANFVKEYHQNIIMTANINASQLLISLAENCGEDYMKFRRMLDWTDLSEIQKEGEHLFEKVFNNIEKALKSN